MTLGLPVLVDPVPTDTDRVHSVRVLQVLAEVLNDLSLRGAHLLGTLRRMLVPDQRGGESDLEGKCREWPNKLISYQE